MQKNGLDCSRELISERQHPVHLTCFSKQEKSVKPKLTGGTLMADHNIITAGDKQNRVVNLFDRVRQKGGSIRKPCGEHAPVPWS